LIQRKHRLKRQAFAQYKTRIAQLKACELVRIVILRRFFTRFCHLAAQDIVDFPFKKEVSKPLPPNLTALLMAKTLKHLFSSKIQNHFHQIRAFRAPVKQTEVAI
jgi:hypothetical protein